MHNISPTGHIIVLHWTTAGWTGTHWKWYYCFFKEDIQDLVVIQKKSTYEIQGYLSRQTFTYINFNSEQQTHTSEQR